jgi:hypothetical protein
MADRMYRKVQRVDDGLFDGIKKLFGGGKKKRRKNSDPEHDVGDKIKFERRNGQNANGVIENVYYNEEDGGIDYGVRSTRSTDNIVVPEENVMDSHAVSVLVRNFPNASANRIASFVADSWNPRLSDRVNVRRFEKGL